MSQFFYPIFDFNLPDDCERFLIIEKCHPSNNPTFPPITEGSIHLEENSLLRFEKEKSGFVLVCKQICHLVYSCFFCFIAPRGWSKYYLDETVFALDKRHIKILSCDPFVDVDFIQLFWKIVEHRKAFSIT